MVHFKYRVWNSAYLRDGFARCRYMQARKLPATAALLDVFLSHANGLCRNIILPVPYVAELVKLKNGGNIGPIVRE